MSTASLPPAPRKQGNWLLYVSLLVTLFLGVGIGGWLVPVVRQWFTPATNRSVVQPPNTVNALGVVEPGSGVLNLGSPLPDRVLEMKVKEGDAVTEGQLLVVFASNLDATEALALAEAQLKESEAKIALIEESGKPQVELARLQLDKAKKLGPLELKAGEDKIKLLVLQQKLAQENVDRMKALSVDTVTKQEREKAQLLLQQADTELMIAQNALERGKVEQELAVKLAEQQLQAAQDAVETAKKQIPLSVMRKQIDQAKARLEATLIKAPTSGRIIRVFSQKGELVGGKPILQMANTEQMTVVAEVYETDIRRVLIGQKASVTSYVLGQDKPIQGEVISIGSSVARNQVFGIDPKGTVDNRIIEVKVRIDAAQAQQLANLIGHQVRVEIKTGG